MKPRHLLLTACVVVGFLIWWSVGRKAPVSQTAIAPTPPPPAAAMPATEPATPAITSAAANPDPDKAPAPSVHGVGPRFKRAYLFRLTGPALALVQAQDLEGDFAPKRGGTTEVWTNMLHCRLLSKSNAVLAEETLPAPDPVCAVLDPRSGPSEPVQYTSPGPVLFQVRLPQVAGAHRLEVYRILEPGEPPVETLLGSFNL